jgi:transposase
MFREYNQDQMYLLPPSLKDFVGENHPAHLINDLVERMDLSFMEKRYGNMGQPAYHPKLMVKVMLYGYSVGIFSSRKLARGCEENLALQYLAGMEKPVYRTFIEFRQRHEEDMEGVFFQTAKLAKEMGMKKLGEVALDGTKVAADTSKHKAMSYGRMKEEEERLKKEIEEMMRKAAEVDVREDKEYGEQEDGYHLKEELGRREERLKKIEEAKAALEARERKDHPGEEIDSKKQISFADTEARCFHKNGSGTQYVYNGQVAVEMESQVIVGNHIEDSVSDAKAVETALEKMEEGLGEEPEKLVMDAGYGNQETLATCEEHEVTPVCATRREGRQEQNPSEGAGEVKDSFIYDMKGNTFTCPHEVVFELSHWNRDGTVATYRSQGDAACSCGRGTSRRKEHRILRVRKSHLVRRKLDHIRQKEENAALYRRRKCTVEPVIGQIKWGMGFRRFLYRGRVKVSSEWNVVCAAFNLKKIAALIRRGVWTPPAMTSPCFRALREGSDMGRDILHRFYAGIARGMHLFSLSIRSISFGGVSLPHPFTICENYNN